MCVDFALYRRPETSDPNDKMTDAETIAAAAPEQPAEEMLNIPKQKVKRLPRPDKTAHELQVRAGTGAARSRRFPGDPTPARAHRLVRIQLPAPRMPAECARSASWWSAASAPRAHGDAPAALRASGRGIRVQWDHPASAARRPGNAGGPHVRR